jgi:tRNA A37 methylthiotransferase MiaB
MNDLASPRPAGRVYLYNREPGCPVNQALTNRIHNFLAANGWTLSEADGADRFVIVSCSALPEMRHRLVAMARDFARQHPSKPVIITCCYMKDDQVELPNVHYVPLSEAGTFDALFGHPGVRMRDVSSGATVEEEHEVRALKDARDEQSVFVRPYNVMVAVGCLNHCAFCSGKSMFATVRSIPIPEVIAECRSGVEKGFTNFIIGASDLASYGRDIGSNVRELFDAIFTQVLEGRPELALGLKGIEPSGLLRHFEELRPFFRSGRIRWLELPIQSGSDAVLRSMNRRYQAADVLQAIREIRAMAPGIRVNTDVIFCYPTETDADFEASLGILDHYDNVQMLMFQRHQETAAAAMQDVFPPEEKARRQAVVDAVLKARGAWTEPPPAVPVPPPASSTDPGFFRVHFASTAFPGMEFDFTIAAARRGSQFFHEAGGLFLEARFVEPPRGVAPLVRVLVAAMRFLADAPPSAATMCRWQALVDEILASTDSGRQYRCTLSFVAD